MTLTDYATKTATTWGQIIPSDILDGFILTEVQRTDDNSKVRAYFEGGGGWGAWMDADRHVSVWR